MSDATTNQKPSLWQELQYLGRLWPFLREDQWVLWVSLLCSPIISGLSLLQPYFIKEIIDKHLSVGMYDGVETLSFGYLGSVIVAYVCSVGYSLGLSWAGMRMLVRLREWLFQRIISLPLSFFDSRPAGMLLTRLTNDIDALGEVIGAGIVTIALDILMVIGCVGLMLWINWELTILLLIFAPILIWMIEAVRRKLQDLYLIIRDSISAVNTFLAEQIDGVEVLQIFRAEERSQQNFDLRNLKFRDASMESNIYDALMFAMVDGMSSVFVALLLWYGTGQLGQLLGVSWLSISPISAGVMVAFIDYLQRLLTPIRDISQKISVIQRAFASLSKIFSLVDEYEPVDTKGIALSNVQGHIVIKNLHFAYQKDDVLRGLNVEIQPGQVVAIVGSSGSGKTTLSRLLDRSYEGYRGSILLDGVELSACALPDLRKNVVSVRQDIQIFSRSVEFNITLDNPNISHDIAQEAVELTCADRMVADIGWDKVLRERGSDLSVGQGQLLTFARMMAVNAPVVILDEATASVDSVTEQQIQQAIENIFSKKTVIVIAHRLSTIQKADKIIVLEKGVIIEEGTHASLLAKGGRYAHLVEAGKSVVG